jgi:hypothetical protein
MLKKIAFLCFVFSFPFSAFGQSCANGESLHQIRENSYKNNQIIDTKIFQYCGILEKYIHTKYSYDGRNTTITIFKGFEIYNNYGYIVYESIDTKPSYQYQVPGDQRPKDKD